MNNVSWVYQLNSMYRLKFAFLALSLISGWILTTWFKWASCHCLFLWSVSCRKQIRNGWIRFRPPSYVETNRTWMRFLPVRLQSERKDQIFPGTASRVSLHIAAADALIRTRFFLLRLTMSTVSFCSALLKPCRMPDEHTNAVSHNLALQKFLWTWRSAASN